LSGQRTRDRKAKGFVNPDKRGQRRGDSSQEVVGQRKLRQNKELKKVLDEEPGKRLDWEWRKE